MLMLPIDWKMRSSSRRSSESSSASVADCNVTTPVAASALAASSGEAFSRGTTGGEEGSSAQFGGGWRGSGIGDVRLLEIHDRRSRVERLEEAEAALASHEPRHLAVGVRTVAEGQCPRRTRLYARRLDLTVVDRPPLHLRLLAGPADSLHAE